MSYRGVKFIDSLNYFHMPLSSLPKAYGLSNIEKGTFPHFFNRPENVNYVGPLPPLEFYSPDTMAEKERESFIAWYNEESAKNTVFDFDAEIVKYCKQDVEILRLACLKFREGFMKFGVDPFLECTTIASTCMRVFKKKFLKEKQIGIIPPGGYRMANNHSVKAIQWLFWMEESLQRSIQHAGRCREKRLTEGILVDGFSVPRPEEGENHRGLVFQFQG